MEGVAVSVMEVVDVVTMREGHMPACFAVGVVVVEMLCVHVGYALVVVTVMCRMEVSVVDVVDVVTMRDRDVSTAVPMDVGVVGVLDMGCCHECSSCACRIVSLTM